MQWYLQTNESCWAYQIDREWHWSAKTQKETKKSNTLGTHKYA